MDRDLRHSGCWSSPSGGEAAARAKPPSVELSLCRGGSVDREEGPSWGEPRAACLLPKEKKPKEAQGREEGHRLCPQLSLFWGWGRRRHC